MDGIAAYRENSITTQSRGRLIVLLYEGAIRFLKQASAALKDKDYAEKGNYINKAIAVIQELNISLDMEGGGEIAMNLRRLYLFMVRYLTEANMNRDPGRIQDVIRLLEDLNEGWKVATA